jgi:diguanylate cyclase (GGDEF)-like protein/PAS domain S-box-containing protein
MGGHFDAIGATDQAQDDVAQVAMVSAYNAYRDTSRLIRLLTVIGQPWSPSRLLDECLLVVSEAFGAAVSFLGHAIGDRLLVASACGLPEGDDAYSAGWPVCPAVVEALRTGRVVVRAPAGPNDVPESLRGIGLRSAVWVPLSQAGNGGDVIGMFLHTDAPFAQSDRHVLASVASRLRLAVEERERHAALERLAQCGHRLARHLDPNALLAESVELLRQVTAADHAWVLVVQGDRAHLGAYQGPDPDPDAGEHPNSAGRWPRPLNKLAGWVNASVGQPFAGPGAGATAPPSEASQPRSERRSWPPSDDREGADREGADRESADQECPGPDGAGRMVLCVPVLREGTPVALLYAARDRPTPFPQDLVEITTIFANYLAAAMANAELYRALQHSESSLRLITDSISDLIAVADGTGRFTYASPSHEREVDHQPAALLGNPVADLVHPEDREPVHRALAAAVGTATTVEYRLGTGSGGWVWVESALRPSGEGAVVLSSRVVNERKRLENELRWQATHDPLTGLANRTLVRQRLDAALAGQAASGVGLLFCDLDRFKAVNDRLGHEAGDELLRQVSDRMQACLRPTDLLARFGGDEFVVVLDGVTELREVAEVGQRLIDTLDRPFRLREEQVRISVSVGGVLGLRGRTTASAMLRDADAAVYTAKDNGTGLVEVFDDAASHRSLDRLDLRSELAHALDRDELRVRYQPVVALDTGAILGFEALVRWAHPLRGEIPPDVFVPLAEESGAIVAMGEWVLARACWQLAAWQRAYPWRRLTMSVNVSGCQLRRPKLAAEILAVVDQAGVDPGDIWLEVTERTFVPADVAAHAEALRAAGLRLALDDFGTWYSNLTYLKSFPAEMVKIDRSFVAGLPTCDRDRSIVRAVLAIGAALGLEVVAEGIETEAQRAELLALGCRSGQGYLLARPLTAADASALLAATVPERAVPVPAQRVAPVT